MNLQYTDTMTGEEYNELRLSVGWASITERQAKSGLEHTTFLMAVRDDLMNFQVMECQCGV